tara:strand:+ start:5694 stop:6611 length:918 start_codon:yes stop_codon:yes gene_type:complete
MTNKLILILFSIILSIKTYSQEKIEKIVFSKDIYFSENLSGKIKLYENGLLTFDDFSKEKIKIYFDSLKDQFIADTMKIFTEYWSTSRLYPYGDIDLSKMEDSVTIYLDEEAFYCSPSDYLFSPFGPRRGRQHKGIDTDLDIGDTLRTMFDGKVRYTNYVKGFGNLVIIRHFNGLETYYAHLDKILISSDKIVKAGDVIGLGGETGNALGPHLHFEFRYKDNAFDPEKIIDLKNQKLKSNVLILTKKDFEWKKQWRERKYHKVKSGDTLGHIAQKNNTSVSKILKINKGLSATSILQIGQNIRVR